MTEHKLFNAVRLNTYRKLAVEGVVVEAYSLESNLAFSDREIFKFEVDDNIDCTLGHQNNDKVEEIQRQMTSGNRHEKNICKRAYDCLSRIRNHPLTSAIIPEEEASNFVVDKLRYLNAIKIVGIEDDKWFSDRK